jgi:hypothetical protein
MRNLKALGLAIAFGLLLAPTAKATYEPLGSGQTKLTLDKSFLAFAKDNGVKLAAVAPAKLKAGTVSFPVVAGKLDPTNSKGTLEHEGALVFKAHGKSVPIKSWQLKTTQKGAPFSAKVGGSQLKLATAKSLKVTRAGFASKVKVTELAISAKLATRLGKKLGLRDAFKAGIALGATQSSANPTTISLQAIGKAELILDPVISQKLASLFVAVNPIFPAERPGAFTLPIFGGTLAPDASSGTIETEGSLELLQLGGGQVFFAESWLDLSAKSFSSEETLLPSPPYGGKLGRLAIAELSLAGAAIAATPGARTVSVQGGSLILSAATAQAFEEVFAQPQGKSGVFAGGEVLGRVSFVGVGE